MKRQSPGPPDKAFPQPEKGSACPSVDSSPLVENQITLHAPRSTLHVPRLLSFGLLLIAATILVYQPVWHAGFIWDDDVYVTENRLLTAPDGLRRIWFSQ